MVISTGWNQNFWWFQKLYIHSCIRSTLTIFKFWIFFLFPPTVLEFNQMIILLKHLHISLRDTIIQYILAYVRLSPDYPMSPFRTHFCPFSLIFLSSRKTISSDTSDHLHSALMFCFSNSKQHQIYIFLSFILSFYIYLHGYTLVGPPPFFRSTSPFWAEPVPPSCSLILSKRKHKR
jgi:hypothetical protein